MKKSNCLTLLAAIACGAYSLSAFAFAPDLFYGAGFFIAKQACPGLHIAQGDSLSLDAEYTHFQLDEVTQAGFTPLVTFSVPDDGSYYFTGDIGLQSTDEFSTNEFDGNPNYDFKLLQQSGDLRITFSDLPASGTCVLTNDAGGAERG